MAEILYSEVAIFKFLCHKWMPCFNHGHASYMSETEVESFPFPFDNFQTPQYLTRKIVILISIVCTLKQFVRRASCQRIDKPLDTWYVDHVVGILPSAVSYILA